MSKKSAEMRQKRSKERRDARNEVIKRIREYFKERYGIDPDVLTAWQDLARDVGVAVANSIIECKKNLRDVWINIVQFVDVMTGVNGQTKVRIFESADDLAMYTEHPGRMFPAKEADDSPILKWMLIRLNDTEAASAKRTKELSVHAIPCCATVHGNGHETHAVADVADSMGRLTIEAEQME